LMDMDTPEDYQKMLTYMASVPLPTEECYKLLKMNNTPVKVIASHMDIFLDPTQAITEKEIVYLADKLVKNNQIILLQDRFKTVLERFKDEPQVQQNISQRFKNAQMIQTQIEYMLQKSLQNLSNLELRRGANG